MMRDSWALRGRPQYILARRLLQKFDNEYKKGRSPKVTNTLWPIFETKG